MPATSSGTIPETPELCRSNRLEEKKLGHPFVGTALSHPTNISIPDSVLTAMNSKEGDHWRQACDEDTRHVPINKATVLTRTSPPSEPRLAPIVGSLNFIACNTCPDITHAVHTLSRYTSSSNPDHVSAACDIVRYLYQTKDMGITYGPALTDHAPPRQSLCGYFDSNYVGKETQVLDPELLSTTGFTFIRNGGAISWQTRIQSTTAKSTAEGEYVAASATTTEALWLRKHKSSAMDTSTSSSETPAETNRTKHIDVAHRFVRQRVLLGEVSFACVTSANNASDVLTKRYDNGQKMKTAWALLGLTKPSSVAPLALLSLATLPSPGPLALPLWMT
eukprot:gene25687-11352_t